MKRNIWLFVIMVVVLGALDALQPFMANKDDEAISFAERAEFWGFAAVLAIAAVTIFWLKRRSKK